MTDKTKPEAMTAERLAEIERISLRPHYGKSARHHVEELLAALKSAQDALAKVEKERDATRTQLEALALDALVHLSKARICTPMEGYIQAPHCLGSDIDALAKERDSAIAASAETAREYAEAVEKLRAARESLDRRDQLLADERARVALLEEAMAWMPAADRPVGHFHPDAKTDSEVHADAAEGEAVDRAAGLVPGWHKGLPRNERAERLAARVAELERDLADSQALTTEHYARAESAYSRGYDAGAADAAARVAELEGALATAIAAHDRFMESAHYSVTYRDSDSEALDVARLAQIGKLRALAAAPTEQAPAPPRTDDGARTRALQDAARMMCEHCATGRPVANMQEFGWQHDDGGEGLWKCGAGPIHDLMACGGMVAAGTKLEEPVPGEHRWLTPEERQARWPRLERDPWDSCLWCGVIRRADGKNSPCRGKVRIEMRESGGARVYIQGTEARPAVCGSTMFEDEDGDPTAWCSRETGHEGDHEMRDGDVTLARWTNHSDAARPADVGAVRAPSAPDAPEIDRHMALSEIASAVWGNFAPLRYTFKELVGAAWALRRERDDTRVKLERLRAEETPAPTAHRAGPADVGAAPAASTGTTPAAQCTEAAEAMARYQVEADKEWDSLKRQGEAAIREAAKLADLPPGEVNP